MEKKGAGGPGLVWMSPQSAKIETRRGRWSDVNRERRGIIKKANGTYDGTQSIIQMNIHQFFCVIDLKRTN